ncbi:unnamed protein product, partial [Ectocarpus sp. 12 AP-2014]
GENKLKEHDVVTIDGSTGEVYLGTVDRRSAAEDEDFQAVLKWADDIRELKILTNADTPEQAATARGLGAQGIGLCRSEHMFFAPERISAMRAMIVSEKKKERLEHLETMAAFQSEDISSILKEMDGLPVTMRLLDPPLHEFLPHSHEEMQSLADTVGKPLSVVKDRVAQLQEVNPMLGFRGCRLSVVYPEITEMQARAAGLDPKPEIMVPVVSTARELRLIVPRIQAAVADELEKANVELDIPIGTMMELPRACVTADEIVGTEGVEFMSFGTNDLTQSVWGFSRDDAIKFIGRYQEQVGICGEHGGEPKSVGFFHSLGFDYVSCSPFRVPIARISAGQAAAQSMLKKSAGDRLYRSSITNVKRAGKKSD